MSVGEKVKDYLSNAGISQTWLSEKTGIPITKLNLALNGNRRMTFEEYEVICWVLNLGADHFIQPRAPHGTKGDTP